ADASTYIDGVATVSLSAIADAASNDAAAPTGTTFTIDTAAPTLTPVSIESDNTDITLATAGDVVTLYFTANEPIAEPVVTFLSGGVAITNSVTYADLGSNDWTAYYTADALDTEGLVSFTISFSDTANNAATNVIAVTDETSVTFANTINVSGTVRQTDESTPQTGADGVTVTIVSEGQSSLTTTVQSDGTYSKAGVTVGASGNAILVYLDNDATYKGSVVTIANDTTSSIENLDIFQDRLIATSNKTATNITNQDFVDVEQAGDTDDLYSISGLNVTVESGHEFHVYNSKDYVPGGTLTTQGEAGHLHLDDNSTADFAANDVIVSGDITIDAGAALTAPSTTLTITGSYTNNGTFTHNSGTVTFDDTTGGKTLSGRLNQSVTDSDFNKVIFNGTGGSWTIQDAMKVSAANAADTFVIGNGTVTLGDGGGDHLEVNGRMTIAATSGQTGTFQTMDGLAQGDTTDCNSDDICIDINNNASAVECLNCIIQVGTTGVDSGQGNLKIRENALVRLNPFTTASDTGIEVEKNGYLEILGNQDDTGTATGTTETTITASAESWGSNDHQYKQVRITNSDSLAFGTIHDISSNTDTVLTIPDDFSVSDTGSASYNPTTRVYTATVSMISADNDGIGQYLYNSTQGKRSRIVDSTEAGTADTIKIANTPDTFAYTATDTVIITYGILTDDTFEILDYAHISAENGTACDATVGEAFESYIYAKQDSETLIQYGDICNLGRSATYKYGVSFDVVDGSQPSEGVTVDKSRMHCNSRGVYLSGSSNNTISNNSVYGSSASYGIAIYSNSKNNTVSSNQVYDNFSGIWISLNSKNNTVSSNQIYNSPNYGIYFETSSDNNILSSNQTFGISTGIYLSAASNNTISSNQAYGNSYGIRLTSSSNNTIFSNQAYNNTIYGVYLVNSSSNNILSSNNSYNNERGLFTTNSSGTIAINDNYGGSGANTISDIRFGDTTSASTVRCHNCTMASTAEALNIVWTGAYLISSKHDTTSGSTKIWGEYSVADENSETPQIEATNKFNYADNLYEKSATAHGYSGTGTEDTDLDYDLSTATLSSGPYSYRAVAQAGGTANCAVPTVFDIYRNNTDTGLDATCGVEFTDTSGSVNVKFKIDGGATAYVLGDTYTFTTWDASGDTSAQKVTTVQQADDTVTVGSGKTMEFDGDSGNLSTLNILTATNAYDLIVDGTLSGGNNDLFVSGNVTGSGTATLTSGSSFSQKVAGASKTFGSTLNANNWTFNNLTFRNATAIDQTIQTNTTGTGQIIVNGTLYTGDGSESNTTTLDNETNDRIFNVNGDVSITSKGILQASSTAGFTAGGDWSNLGTFTPNSGTVTFDGSGAQTINDANTWHGLAITGSTARTVSFESGVTQTIASGGSLDFSGASGQLLTLAPLTAATDWLLDDDGAASQSVSYVSVSYSDANAGVEIDASDGTNVDGDNNTNWKFSISAAPTATAPTASQATDGSGLVTIETTIDDTEDDDTCRFKVEYSLDGGGDWTNGDPYLDSYITTNPDQATEPDITNTEEYQVGMLTNNIITSAGANTVTIKWDTQSASNGIDGALTFHDNVKLRITPYDGTTAGTPVISASAFTVDNTAPLLFSATRDTDTQIRVTLNELAAAITIIKSDDGGFIVADTVTPANTYTVSAVNPGATDDLVILTVADIAASDSTGVTITYTATGNGTVTDVAGNALATDAVGVNVNAWAGNTASTATAPVASQATDGSGLVTIETTIDDVDDDDTCRFKVEYSLDGGGTWTSGDPYLSAYITTSPDQATEPDVTNTEEYQVGMPTNNIITSAGANTVIIKWDTQSASNGTGALTLETNVKLRITPHDGTGVGTPVISAAAFTVDNSAPTVTLSDDHPDLTVRDADTVEITATFNENMASAPTVSIDVSTDADADIVDAAMTVSWSCGSDLVVAHIGADVAPVDKTVTYGTVSTNLTGSDKCWITQNLGATQQAATATDDTEASAGWYWQFNRKQGYKHDGTRTPDTVWIGSISEELDWEQANDPCTLLLGAGWRLPTEIEWTNADANGEVGGWDNYNETFADVLKLHVAGWLSDNSGDLFSRGSNGHNWSSTQSSSSGGYYLNFNSGFTSILDDDKTAGVSVRCLRDSVTTTWTYSWDVPAGHSADTATLTVDGYDIAGNAYVPADDIVYTIDNTVPLLSSATRDTDTQIRVTLNELAAATTIIKSDDG
ncbi:MAG: right-handed parallel beta-helix repeat-containing protein, partial [Candidatus Pacebacteria bacterium]|nr:right-handed parallel beta-helix repeat-containing protein [Candidatus Paceibacterota bacterium]